MAIKHIIAKGIGFSPGSVKFIPPHGFATSAVVAPTVFRRLIDVHTRTRIVDPKG